MSNWNERIFPEIELKLFDQKDDCLSDLTYSGDELRRLLEGKKKYEPKSFRGKMTEKEYVMVDAIRVPYGKRKIAEKMAEQLGYKVRKL